MRTRSNFYPSNSTANISRRSNRRRIPNIVEPEIQTIAEIIPMADRTMEELLQAPMEGYGEAIGILEILAENFKIKMNLLYKVPIVKSSLPTLTPFGEKDSNKLPVIIAKNLKVDEKEALINVLKSHKRAIARKISDIKGIDPRFCTHKILMEDDYKLAVQSQRWVNPKIHDIIKKEVIKLLDAGMIYHISYSPWVSPIHYVPKKGGMIVVANENNVLIPTRIVTGWRVCIDYRKLNDATRKDHFPLPFMDQMLERLKGNEFYCFLDGFSGEGIVLGHKISKSGIKVDKAKVDVISKLPHPTTLKGVRSFLGHAGFYRRFIQDFSKIARPMTHLLEKETPFVFSKEKLFKFSKLAMRDLLRAIMVPISQQRRQGKISQKDEMPQNSIQVCEIFNI
nr:reverse transcriptase domain-containing protein [Tanacetum cinerariifolium]